MWHNVFWMFFVEVIKERNHTRLWDAELTRYSSSTTDWICPYGFENGPENPHFKAYPKFPGLQGSCCLSEISWTIWLQYCHELRFHLSYNKWFWLLPRRHSTFRTCKSMCFWIKTMFHAHICSFQITHRVKQYKMCQRTSCHNTTDQNGYLPRLELLRRCDICTPN